MIGDSALYLYRDNGKSPIFYIMDKVIKIILLIILVIWSLPLCIMCLMAAYELITKGL